MDTSSHSSTLIGWREWVAMPDQGLPWIKAKIDTGARTSALHAFDVEEYLRGSIPWVRFCVHPWQDSTADAVAFDLPVHDRRRVRSSSGHSEERLVVLLAIRLAARRVEAEITLTNRVEMGFRMLIGREVLRNGFIIDPRRSFVGGRAPRSIRLRNRGRV